MVLKKFAKIRNDLREIRKPTISILAFLVLWHIDFSSKENSKIRLNK